MGSNPINVLRDYLGLRREHWLGREQIESIQQRRYEAITDTARLLPYYRRRFESCGDSPSKDLEMGGFPILPKDDVRMSPNDFINPSIPRKKLFEMQTSGSTGTPLGVVCDQQTFEHRHAIGLLLAQDFRRSPRDLLVEISRKSDSFAPFAVPGLFRKKHLSIFLEESELFRSVRRLGPDSLGWYPSMAQTLARINDSLGRPVRLKSVFCGGEALSARVRASIEESFSCRVYEQYASVEFSALAWECPEEHRLHVNDSSFLIEVIDGRGKPIKSGTGDLAVTCFFNRAMPLVRYMIGDRAKWGRECSCGRGTRVLDSISGRSDDFIVLPSGKHRSAFAFNLLYYGEKIEGIWKYQIVQEREDLLVFRYVPEGRGLSGAGCADLRKRISKACLYENVKLEFEAADSIPREKSGKLRKIISKPAQRLRTGDAAE
jgi:phenylacetate-CoA ligase